MPAAAASERITHRAVPLMSGVAPNAAVHASESMASVDSAPGSVTVMASPETVAADFTASDNSFTVSNICASTSWELFGLPYVSGFGGQLRLGPAELVK